MKKAIIVVAFVILLFLSSSALYSCIDSNNKSISGSSENVEKTKEQITSDILNELDGLNVGPKPSGFIEPTLAEVDSIPTNQVNQQPLP